MKVKMLGHKRRVIIVGCDAEGQMKIAARNLGLRKKCSWPGRIWRFLRKGL